MKRFLSLICMVAMIAGYAVAADPVVGVGIVVGDTIVPGSDTYSASSDRFHYGGWHSVSNEAARTNLVSYVRKAGMSVFQWDTAKLYYLGTNLTTWTEFTSGGGGGDVYAASNNTFTGENYFQDYVTFDDLVEFSSTVELSGEIYAIGSFTAYLQPESTLTYDLGDATHYWRKLYVSTIDALGVIETDYTATNGLEVVNYQTMTNALSGWSQYPATQDVDIVGYNFNNVGIVKFDTANTNLAIEGEIKWNNDDGVLEYGAPGGSVRIQIGQELTLRARNDTGATITNGTPVYISGSTGTKAIIGLATATNHIIANATIALATEDISNGQFGVSTIFGLVRDIDTTFVIAAGMPAFLGTTPGELVSSLPDQPNSQTFIGVVVRKHATEGVILVKIITQPNLEELSDIFITSTADGDCLQWDATDGRWENTNTLSRLLSYNSTDGLTIERQSTYITNVAGTVYFETELIGGGDLDFIFDGVVHVLDCTTGSGIGGRARVAVTSGTDTVPIKSYMYAIDGGTTAVLTNNTTYPTGEFSMLADVLIKTPANTLANGPMMLRRWSDPVAHDGRGKISRNSERSRARSATLDSGAAVTITDDAAGSLTIGITSGVIWQHHRQSFSGFADPAGFSLVNHNSTPFIGANDLGTITNDSTGTLIANKRYFAVWVGCGISSGEDGVDRVGVWLSSGAYSLQGECEADSNGYDDTAIPEQLTGIVVPLARVIMYRDVGGTWGHISTTDKRFPKLSDSGGGGVGGAPVSDEHPDTLWRLYDDGDITKLMAFELNGITTGNTRTMTVPDASGTLALIDIYNVFSVSNRFEGPIHMKANQGIRFENAATSYIGRIYGDTTSDIVIENALGNKMIMMGATQILKDDAGVWNSEGTAVSGLEIVNYQTMTNWIDGGSSDAALKSAYNVFVESNQFEGDIIIYDDVNGDTITMIAESGDISTIGALDADSFSVAWATVTTTATTGVEVVNYQTMTNLYHNTIVAWVSPPAATNSAGTAGMAAYTNNYLYICVSNATWRRTTLAAW